VLLLPTLLTTGNSMDFVLVTAALDEAPRGRLRASSAAALFAGNMTGAFSALSAGSVKTTTSNLRDTDTADAASLSATLSTDPDEPSTLLAPAAAPFSALPASGL
jgi:hypothetical protein